MTHCCGSHRAFTRYVKFIVAVNVADKVDEQRDSAVREPTKRPCSLHIVAAFRVHKEGAEIAVAE